MAREKVTIELNVEQAAAVQGWLAAQGSMVQYENQLGKLQKTSERAAQGSKQSWGSAADAIHAFATNAMQSLAIMQTVATVAQLINREIEAANRRNRNAKDQQVDLSTARRRLADSVAGGDVSAGQAEALIKSRATVGQKEATLAAEAAAKEAGRDFSHRRALETSLEAGRLAPHLAPEGGLPDLAAGAVDLQKQQPGLTPTQAVAQLLRLGRYTESRPEEVAKDLIPAVARGRLATGGKTSAGDLSAFYLTLADRMDVGAGEGATTGEMLLKQLTKRGGGSLDEMLAAARGDSRLGDKIAQSIKNPRAASAVADFLRGGAGFEGFQQLRRELGASPEEVAREEEARAQSVGQLPGQRAAEAKRAYTAGTEGIRDETGRAMAALSQDELLALLSESGMSGLETTTRYVARGTRNFFGGAPGERQSLQEQIGLIREWEGGMRLRAENREAWRGAGDPSVMDTKTIIEKLDRVADALERQLVLMDNPPPQPVTLPADVQPGPVAAEALQGK